MTQAENPALDKLAELRARYLDQIAHARDTVKYYLNLESTGELTSAARLKLHRLSHKIAGSGGSYGYARLSSSARRVEQLSGPDGAVGGGYLRHALRTLIEEMDHVAVDPTPQPAPAAKPAKPLQRPEQHAQPAAQPGLDRSLIKQRLAELGSSAAAQRANGAAQQDPADSEIPQPPPDPRPEERPQSRALAPQAAAPAPVPVNRARPRVLIVEDDPAVADLLKGAMESEFDVSRTDNGADAVAVAERERPHLIVLDDNLPGRTGTEILGDLQHHPSLSAVPVVMLTATADAQHVLRALESGAINYFTKPVDIGGFVDYLRFLLAQPQEAVLIVDDDPQIRALLADRFRSNGIGVTEAESGMDALRKLRDSTPRLVILDRMMPGMEGGPVLNELRRRPQFSSVPVIMLTSPSSEGDGLQWLQRGAVDFIAKPFNPDEVVFRAMRAMGMTP